jgi:alkylation response protein AidB-like acyl-CoA dehydrogenase
MPTYTAPTDELDFVLFDVFDAESLWASLPAFRGVNRELVRAILEAAANLAEQEFFPLNQIGDAEGSRWIDGEVRTPPGFRDAYEAFTGGGWLGIAGEKQYGGQGMPKMLTVAWEEMFYAANTGLFLYTSLTAGACILLAAHASDELKRLCLPKLYEGRWSATMDLTEPQAGSDLGIITTKAEPRGDGIYAITGSKIFITSGEHDLTENILHLVLAKLPDAPAGSRGISLFLVPKFLINDDGTLGERNAVTSASLEKKMGIRGSATSAMRYEGATGLLIGEENRGLAAMFTMMNYERLSIGIQGLGIAEVAYQNARDYARERLQGRAPTGPELEGSPADPIIVHPDVRRMLLAQKAYNEGCRAFAVYVGSQLDLARHGDDDARRQAADRVALLTPVAKAFLSDRGFENAVLAQQVLGGHGYIRESGLEQYVRDARIAQIYEGTNGIQAMDLIERKVIRDGGRACHEFCAEMRADLSGAKGATKEAAVEAIALLESVTALLVKKSKNDPALAGASAVDYMDLFGHVVLAWLWLKMVDAAKKRGADAGRSGDKRKTAEFYFAKLLPKVDALARSIRAGSKPVMGLSPERF